MCRFPPNRPLRSNIIVSSYLTDPPLITALTTLFGPFIALLERGRSPTQEVKILYEILEFIHAHYSGGFDLGRPRRCSNHHSADPRQRYLSASAGGVRSLPRQSSPGWQPASARPSAGKQPRIR